jgi:hypothetical protein
MRMKLSQREAGMNAEESLLNTDSGQNDPAFRQEIQRLHKLTVYGRWFVVCWLWLLIAPICLWNLRSEIELWREYFTWAALRYGLAFHPFAAFGLALCVGMTVSVLLWQSRNILFGISDRQTRRLEQQVLKIRQQGSSHPLWKWVCR